MADVAVVAIFLLAVGAVMWLAHLLGKVVDADGPVNGE